MCQICMCDNTLEDETTLAMKKRWISSMMNRRTRFVQCVRILAWDDITLLWCSNDNLCPGKLFCHLRITGKLAKLDAEGAQVQLQSSAF